MWTISSSDNPVNLDQVQTLLVIQDGSVWYIDAADIDGTNIARLKGSWASKVDAAAAARRLVDAVDVSTY